MNLKELIGRKIVDILIQFEAEPYGLDKAECYFVLEDELVVGLPFGFDDEDVWIRVPPKTAISFFQNGKWWQEKRENVLLQGSKIVDIISYPESPNDIDKVFVCLDNNKLITEVTTANHGTGHAGLWIYNSISEVEKKYGDNYLSLLGLKAAPNSSFQE